MLTQAKTKAKVKAKGGKGFSEKISPFSHKFNEASRRLDGGDGRGWKKRDADREERKTSEHKGLEKTMDLEMDEVSTA